MIFQSSCIGFKSSESPGHSKTDIPLISIMCYADLDIALHYYASFIGMLISMTSTLYM